ncbi:hypothetical protein Salat_2746000 [Sesamum alatum]|uniref:Uncharacterized protein n=1 Tax=Sesamum alatum TaxID=300844 RepID=A0AAE1XKD7_9LAMI|nr:hypothetical protein Salat_2746000 [Sesamum alatum]
MWIGYGPSKRVNGSPICHSLVVFEIKAKLKDLTNSEHTHSLYEIATWKFGLILESYLCDFMFCGEILESFEFAGHPVAEFGVLGCSLEISAFNGNFPVKRDILKRT